MERARLGGRLVALHFDGQPAPTFGDREVDILLGGTLGPCSQAHDGLRLRKITLTVFHHVTLGQLPNS